MSMKVPEAFSKAEFARLRDKTLSTEEFKQYRSLVTNSYKRTEDRTEFRLRDEISEEVRANLAFVFKRISDMKFDSLEEIARYFRGMLNVDQKKFILLFAYNGTGKTRLSTEFKRLGQKTDEETGEKVPDTLYYNAFTEDLFYWDNDLENDTNRYLKMNRNSRFFSGLEKLEMESKIRNFLHLYVDFDFTIDYDKSRISFFKNEMIGGVNRRADNIKISRGEENLFIWCFFLAIVQLVIDKEEAYDWVRYIYIDDPVSSLDDNNVVAMAGHLVSLMSGSDIQVIISSHHTLFYNVLCNETTSPERLFFKKNPAGGYILKNTGNTPNFYHIALLKDLKKAADSGEIYSYHFNILRDILEKTAAFHGYAHFSDCLRKGDGSDEIVQKRMVNIMSHGNYSVFEPTILTDDNKEHFRRILKDFLEDYHFNERIFNID